MTKKDGRSKNGAASQGLGEDAYLVRGPKELFGAMRALAKSRGQSLAYVWRAAGEGYLRENTSGKRKS